MFYRIKSNIYSFCKSNARQILEILIWIFVVSIPYVFDLDSFARIIPEDILPNYIRLIIHLQPYKKLSSLVIFCVYFIVIRRFNKEYTMNKCNVYHNYPYLWYWFCSKILGIKKCNLILVPIFMQFLLVIRETFDEFPLNLSEFPLIENESVPISTTINGDNDSNEINLILEDTYPIEIIQLPYNKKMLKTVKVSRNDGIDFSRHSSPKFVAAVANSIRHLNPNVTINIYSTTNPMNTVDIAKSVFLLADRGNVTHLYVFQQEIIGERVFKSPGHIIY